MKHIQAVFDLDGVLVDTLDSVYNAYRQAFESVGRNLTRATFLDRIWGRPWVQASRLLSAQGVTKGEVELIRAARMEIQMKTPIVLPMGILMNRFHWENILIATSGSLHATKLKTDELKANYIRGAFAEDEFFPVVEHSVDKLSHSFWDRFDKTKLVVFDDDPIVCAFLQSIGIIVCRVLLPKG